MFQTVRKFLIKKKYIYRTAGQRGDTIFLQGEAGKRSETDQRIYRPLLRPIGMCPKPLNKKINFWPLTIPHQILAQPEGFTNNGSTSSRFAFLFPRDEKCAAHKANQRSNPKPAVFLQG